MGNPNYRLFGLAIAKFGKASTATANTFTDTGDLVTAASHGLSNGTPIIFQTITTTTGVTTFVRYYLISATTNTFQVSTTYGGSAAALTTDGSGTFKSITYSSVYLPNNWDLTNKAKDFTYAGADTEIDRTQILGYSGELSADCVPMATHMFLFGMTAQTTALPDGYTSQVYGGTITERGGVTAELYIESSATRVDATTNAPTDMTIRDTYWVCTVSGVQRSGRKTGDKPDVEKYKVTMASTTVDIAGGALPATVPTGGVFMSTMEK
jgi:hypothetical protein